MSLADTLRVAIVGSGPAGMYAAGHLLESPAGTFVDGALHDLVDSPIEVDVFDRLPTPWGLLRAGVAPDHLDKKRMSAVYESIAQRRGFRFFGNVDVGGAIATDMLQEWYDAVIYAVGANDVRRLGIPGEQLRGSWAARDFVAWYNGHPDCSSLEFDLNTERAVLVGNGNVALDVARVLFSPEDVLQQSDIADYALEAIAQSTLREIVILGRRGPQEAAFSYQELAELGELPDTAIVVEGAELDGDWGEGAAQNNLDARLKIATLRRLTKEKTVGSRRIVFRFNAAPSELVSDQTGRLSQLLVTDKKGQAAASALPTSLLFSAIGYRGLPIEGLPFDDVSGVIPSSDGRVVSQGHVVPGVYVTGWIRRGPKGIIGSNKKCSRDAVMSLLYDFKEGVLPRSGTLSRQAVEAEIKRRVPIPVPLSGWRNIDCAERRSGAQLGRPRLKITSKEALLAATRR